MITVGAMKSTDGNRVNDTIATYSSPGQLDFIAKPDIVAAGNRVVSVLANGSQIDQLFGSAIEVPFSDYKTDPDADGLPKYMQISGTSMAVPVMAGAAALMLQAQPNLSPDTIKARLMTSARKWAFPSGEGSISIFGAGYLDIPGGGSQRGTLVPTNSDLRGF